MTQDNTEQKKKMSLREALAYDEVQLDVFRLTTGAQDPELLDFAKKAFDLAYPEFEEMLAKEVSLEHLQIFAEVNLVYSQLLQVQSSSLWEYMTTVYEKSKQEENNGEEKGTDGI